MIDFNLIFNEAKKTESFWDFSQNWFDVLTLVLTILSLWLAYFLGERGYKRDKKDKGKEQKQLIETEMKLFKINLEELLKAINKQLAALELYKAEQNFSLKYYQDVQVDFLKFVNQKSIYENIGFENEQKINEMNELFSLLFGLNDFRFSLKDSLRYYILRYSEFEKGFYLYRKLMYKMMHEIANKNAIDLIPGEGGVHIDFGTNEFARNFFHLNQSCLYNSELLDEKNQLIRPKLIELFIHPAIELSKHYIPANADAIEVADVANEINSSWINMEQVTKAHFNEIEAHIGLLKKVKESISEFLELKQH